jgi:hypothetical protein
MADRSITMNLPTNENTIQKNERICPLELTSPMFELSRTGNPIIPVATVTGFTSLLATYIRIFPSLSVLWSYKHMLIFSVNYLILFKCFQFHPYLFTSITSQFPVDLFFITILYSQLSWYRDGLRAGWAGFGSRQGKDFSLLHSAGE